MKKSMDGLDKFIPQTRWAFGVGVLVALGVLAGTIFSGLLFVRGLVREQIIRRDAEALYATILMEQLDDEEQRAREIRSDAQIGFDAALRASRLKGVLGIRFYNVDGVFSDSFPATILPLELSQRAWDAVGKFTPACRFYSELPLSSVFIYLPQFADGRIARIPALEITVPLHRRDAVTLVGAAQFIVEGRSVASEYARLDRRLIQISVITFAVSGMLLVVMLWPAFHRLEKLSADLAIRGERLLRANDELALSARAAALGAISAHLMHGLKNPLASLSSFVAGQDAGASELDSEEWQDALTASRRMQSLVERTLEVIGDVQGGPTYELSVGELVEDVQKRVAVVVTRSKVQLVVEANGSCVLTSRIANLVALVLVNIVENAVEATPPSGSVLLSAIPENDRLVFRVKDGGPGFPEQLREHIFLPCKSTREGGSGLGLAISRQVADHMDARLELEASSPNGCIFRLDLPMSVCVDSMH